MQPDRIIRALERRGLTYLRERGSHVMMMKPGLLRPVVIPRHGREVSGNTTEKILRQAGVAIDEFLANL